MLEQTDIKVKMRLHPRYQDEARSRVTIERAIQEGIEKAIEEDEDLTSLEIVRILYGAAGHWVTYALREERHPDDESGEKKADEA